MKIFLSHPCHFIGYEGKRMNRTYRYRVGRCGMDLSGSEQGPVASSCEYSNKPSSSIQARQFLE